MAPMKRKAEAAGVSGAVRSKSMLINNAIKHADECSPNVKKMLCGTLALTVGTHKSDRHPFNERFVAMIEQVLHSEQARATNDVASKEAAFAVLTPAKADREAARDQAKAHAIEQGAALDAANQAVKEGGAAAKSAAAELVDAKKAQKSGDAELETVEGNKAQLSSALNHLVQMIEGNEGNSKEIIAVGNTFKFDSSLMSTAPQVLDKTPAERGAFDGTTLQQLQDAFNTAISQCNDQLAAGAPGKAERAAAVEHAEAAKLAAETSHADRKAAAAAAKDAKSAADVASKEAAKTLADFMPDLKAAGDALDESKKALQAFIDGPQAAFAELKEFKEGDFVKVKKVKHVEDEGAIDAPVEQMQTEVAA